MSASLPSEPSAPSDAHLIGEWARLLFGSLLEAVTVDAPAEWLDALASMGQGRVALVSESWFAPRDFTHASAAASRSLPMPFPRMPSATTTPVTRPTGLS